MTVYMVSGHLDLTLLEFETHYVPLLEAALEQAESSFVVGDARGADELSQRYLASRKARVLVFHMFQTPRNHHGDFPTCGGFQSDSVRDRAMTKASDEDIAWVRPGRERSGTARNLERRRKLQA